MFDALTTASPFVNIGLGGLVTMIVIAIITGKLVPVSQLERIVSVYAQIADDLRKANISKDEAVRLLANAVNEHTQELSRLSQAIRAATLSSPERQINHEAMEKANQTK